MKVKSRAFSLKRITPVLFSLLTSYSLQSQQKILFVSPPFEEADAKLKPAAEGIWSAEIIGNLYIQKTGDNFYHLWYGDDKHRPLFEAIFFQVQDQLFLDLRAIRDSVWDKDYEQSFLAMHSIYKVKIANDTLYISEPDYSWFYDLIVQGKSGLNYFFTDNGTVISSTTEGIKTFLSKHINEPHAFKETGALIRIHNNYSFKDKQRRIVDTSVSDNVAKQDYPLSFPMKDGWLGADNDASIPISNNRTLWLFGDTYVGYKHQSNRDSIVAMVHSSAAVTGKTADGNYSIHYYWKDMYTPKPKSLFETHTERYVYWIKDGFVYGKDLYVLLRKIGALPGAKGDEIFSFTLGGSAFAIIRDFENTTPDQWKEELILFPYLYDSTFDCEQFVKEGRYIYFFLNRKSKPRNITQLVRLPIHQIDSAENYFEYFSKSREWKKGMDSAEMLTILNYEPGNTIRFNSDLKLWVMVRGPGFMDRRIYLHTSPTLTGPWTEAKVVYECAEQTPGSPIYNKNNFCYLGREHPQFYDKKKREMLITYDWNTSDFKAIKANPNIYVPRIIWIPLNK